MEERVLLLALRGRDAEVLETLLSRQGHRCCACPSVETLTEELGRGAGAALVTEESLVDADRRELNLWLEGQPPWSDFPFILLSTKRAGRRPRAAAQVLEQLGNVIVLERPIHGETLISAVKSALRGRAKQYEARRRLEELKAAEYRLTDWNAALESRIEQRTAELSRANNQLMQEVAERERAQAALAQSQKMEAVGQLTGGIAHDFNNLLTVIVGNLQLIQRRTDDERTTRLARHAREAADRAARLTHQLLAFSRSQRLILKPLSLNGLLQGMQDLLARTIGPQFSVEMALEPGEPWALADANQLELAILNLVINARDAMRDGGVLRIESDRRPAPDDSLAPGDYAVVTVRDTGDGIPPRLLEKVFDPFFTTKPIGKGTGLGLSQVYGIARQSGGTVRIHSVEGEGSSVEIWLPLTDAVTAAETAPAATDPGLAGGRERVLVVEDDDGVRRFMVECLEALGYVALEASDGREGLARIDADRPELLIVDFAMPGMNGAEVISEARSRDPGLPIILATGYADMEAVDQVMNPEHVLRKPFQLDELKAAIRVVLADARADAG